MATKSTIKIVQPIIIQNKIQQQSVQQTQSSIIRQTTIKPSKTINFIYGFHPIYYFARICGLMPFSIQYNMNGDLQKPTVRLLDWVIYSIFVIVFLTITRDDGFNVPASEHMRLAFIPFLFGKLVHYINICSVPIILALEMINRSKLICILTSFNTFDKNVS